LRERFGEWDVNGEYEVCFRNGGRDVRWYLASGLKPEMRVTRSMLGVEFDLVVVLGLGLDSGQRRLG
jgi:hypothetical protein